MGGRELRGMIVALLAALAIVPVYAQSESCPDCISGEVSRIIDGDTLDIDNVRVRLALVDAPERGDPGFEEATAFAASLCKVGSVAFYDEDDGQPEGSHGRAIAEVFCGEKSLNAELVQNGHAKILDRFCVRSEFAAESWTGCPEPTGFIDIAMPADRSISFGILTSLIILAVMVPVVVMLVRLFRK